MVALFLSLRDTKKAGEFGAGEWRGELDATG